MPNGGLLAYDTEFPFHATQQKINSIHWVPLLILLAIWLQLTLIESQL